MIADLHSHYPMHLVPLPEGGPVKRAKARLLSLVWRDVHRALLVSLVGRFLNRETPFSGDRVTMAKLRQGNVGIALSVLYQPADEFTFASLAGRGPKREYLVDLERQVASVAEHVERHHADDAIVVRTLSDLHDARAQRKLALVHCVEGGFQLGSSVEEVKAGVGRLADAGVAYITLAHLFYRRVATSANAFPFIGDRLFHRLLRQPDDGLCALGEAAIEAMVDRHVLVDVSHMDEHALRRTFAMLDELDPSRTVPVVATHAAFRFGDQDYNLTEETVRQIARRDGVIGLILADHQLCDDTPRPRPAPKTLDETAALLARHAKRISEIAGSDAHVALGSDLDGFIKPVTAGTQDAAALRELPQALADHLDAKAVEALMSANAARVIEWVFTARA